MIASRPTRVTASTLAVTGSGVLRGLSGEETGGTNPVVVKIHDSLDNSGTVIFESKVAAGTTVPADAVPPDGVAFAAGCYVEITGTGTFSGDVYTSLD